MTYSLVQGTDPRQGLPQLRREWVAKREARDDTVCTQMAYARQGIVTEEMAFAAAREGVDPQFVRSEVGGGAGWVGVGAGVGAARERASATARGGAWAPSLCPHTRSLVQASVGGRGTNEGGLAAARTEAACCWSWLAFETPSLPSICLVLQPPA